MVGTGLYNKKKNIFNQKISFLIGIDRFNLYKLENVRTTFICPCIDLKMSTVTDTVIALPCKYNDAILPQ